jgi:hypothetical protein
LEREIGADPLAGDVGPDSTAYRPGGARAAGAWSAMNSRRDRRACCEQVGHSRLLLLSLASPRTAV